MLDYFSCSLFFILLFFFFFVFFNDTATTEIYTLSLHDALPISSPSCSLPPCPATTVTAVSPSARLPGRSEEHTSELQSPCNLVCRRLLEKKRDTRETGGGPLRSEADTRCATYFSFC